MTNPHTLPGADPDEKDRLSTQQGVSKERSPDGKESPPVELAQGRRFAGERIFRWLTTGSGILVLVIIIAIGYFLVAKAIPALQANTANFLTTTRWDLDPVPAFGIAALATGTLITSAIALIIAVPIAIGIALCLSHYAHRRVATILGFIIDLLAAVPSIIFGLWGRDYLVGPVKDFSAWLHSGSAWLYHYLHGFPILGGILGPKGPFGSEGPYGKSLLLGSIILAIMILPITTALSREVFMQTPKMNEEAAYALGATKWEMIRTAVLPYGRPGIIAAVMLGLGRALGETIALAMTLGGTYAVSWDILGIGGNTIAANIANRFGEATDVGRGALIASGLVLFAITLVVNVAARAVIYRRREFRSAL
jgi:phosphate transport system permease protein